MSIICSTILQRGENSPYHELVACLSWQPLRSMPITVRCTEQKASCTHAHRTTGHWSSDELTQDITAVGALVATTWTLAHLSKVSVCSRFDHVHNSERTMPLLGLTYASRSTGFSTLCFVCWVVRYCDALGAPAPTSPRIPHPTSAPPTRVHGCKWLRPTTMHHSYQPITVTLSTWIHPSDA